MAIVKIIYPQIVFETKELEVTEDQKEEIGNFCEEEKVDFIWNNLDDLEKNWIPDDKKGLESAVDCDYAKIKL